MTEPGLLKAFFLLASAKGWAGEGTKTTSVEFPGAKIVTVEEEGFLRYIDCYYTYPGSDRSFGQTVIWANDRGEKWIPVWGMQFGGYYPESVIAFLKEALQHTYETKQFIGGRGPLEFQQGDLCYVNEPKKNECSDFEGEEKVFVNGVQVGFHWYRGLLLIPGT